MAAIINYCLFSFFSNSATPSYINAAKIQSITTLAMTKSSLNTCPPYTIR